MSDVGRIPLLLGVVLDGVHSYARLVDALSRSPLVAGMEYTYGPPLYKGTPQIVEALKTANTALEKFDAYFRHGILNREAREELARLFRRQYLARFPRSEGQDVYLASGNVLGISFELLPPLRCPRPDAALRACRTFSHDDSVLAAAERGDQIDRALRAGQLKIFLEGVQNTRRMEIPAVAKLVEQKRMKEPCTFELAINGALPGLFVHAIEPIVTSLGGGLALLPG
ncbi:MAG: hypothetical protein AB2A00_21550 [Myxococcota bacterium]